MSKGMKDKVARMLAGEAVFISLTMWFGDGIMSALCSAMGVILGFASVVLLFVEFIEERE